ncbi:MAG TPA: type IV toxin-antitoxin system AbiEi family antitoxin domain-containing protein [Anaerolineaceae bacterium]|nr:type IV toxin-antitoxin system AbiEi family antitoxin domain-containing protein [Anaerolineaceae bacterium]
MNKNILSSLERLPYFTIEAVKQIVDDESLATGTIQTALYRWVKSGEIIRIKRGVYLTRRFYELHGRDSNFAPALSTIIIPQSYVSLEYILQRYGILTDVTYPVTAITFKQTRVITNELGTFTYHNLKTDLYTGFTFNEYMRIPFAQATKAKALFDYLFLRTRKIEGRSIAENLAQELRLDLEDFTKGDQDEFARYVDMSQSNKMKSIMADLRKTEWQN